MLAQKAQTTLIPVVSSPLVQAGAPYACPACGQPALGLVPWPVNPANPCKLDDWAAHIWYLRRNCGCRTGGRVARLGDCITPLEFSYDRSLNYEQRVQANITALRDALALLSAVMPANAPEPDRKLDQPGTGGSNGHST
ncbi:MAG: hypothetical protein IT317_10695 [Anaerolineales bacterium]|nr:hypothetical protein [Anaerolineales bacterium]